MNRAEFLTRLRRGLKGLPPETVDEIVRLLGSADHEAPSDRSGRPTREPLCAT